METINELEPIRFKPVAEIKTVEVEDSEEENVDEPEVEEIQIEAEVEVTETEMKPARKAEPKPKPETKVAPEVITEPEIIAPEVKKITFIVNGIVVESPEDDSTAENEGDIKTEKINTKTPKSKNPSSPKSKSKQPETSDDTQDIYRTKEDEDGQLTLF